MKLVAEILFALFLGSFAYAGLVAAPWVPCMSRDLERIKRLAGLKPGQKMADIGAGNAKVLIALAANAAGGNELIGYEISLLPYLLGKLGIFFSRFSRGSRLSQSFCGGQGSKNKVKLRYSDFTRQPLRQFDVVYCFLMPKFLLKFKAKLEKELKPGSKFISYVFPVPGWTPTLVDKPNPKDLPIYVYVR